MSDPLRAAAEALLAAAKPDNADHGRTQLVPRVMLAALRDALAQHPGTMQNATGADHHTPRGGEDR